MNRYIKNHNGSKQAISHLRAAMSPSLFDPAAQRAYQRYEKRGSKLDSLGEGEQANGVRVSGLPLMGCNRILEKDHFGTHAVRRATGGILPSHPHDGIDRLCVNDRLALPALANF
jgi:hypothetical protein